MLKFASSCAGLMVAGSALAGSTQVDVFVDSQNDLFDNGFANLDISQVTVTQSIVEGAISIDLAITTRGMSDWTKYMIFMDTGAEGTGSNPWNRPIDFGGQGIDSFVGGWIDGGGGNQAWGFAGAWFLGGGIDFSVDWEANTVHYTIVASNASAGQVIGFDVATSGGGSGDAGVDHLSRSDMAMGGWGQTSYAGQFLSFTVIPAPGAIALFGLAGLTGSRRRR